MAFDATTFEIDPLTLTTPRARLEYLRDFLRGLPETRFNMEYFSTAGLADGDDDYASASRIRNDCGTTACIAGWAVALFTENERADGTGLARTLLDLHDDAAHLLFYANACGGRRSYWDATPAEAAAVIDHLLNTGEVDWSVARKAKA